MLKIGITGGIGSGKSTICRVFETLGIPIFNADIEAKKAMVNDPVLVKEIQNNFGQESYQQGQLNNKYLANIVFNNDDKLKTLNQLVHPAVYSVFDHWVNKLPQTTSYCIKEAAVLFESKSYLQCDINILVTSPFDLKIARVIKRDSTTIEQVKARMDKQLSDEEKLKLANEVIVNDEQQSIIEQVLRLHQKFCTIK